MNPSETPQPLQAVGTGPTRRMALAVGGGIGLAAVLAACGAAPKVPVAAAAPASGAAAEPVARPHYVRITTTGATFSPAVELAAGSGATVSWEVEGGAAVSSLKPTIRFGTAATRHVRMTVDDGGADGLDQVITFNLGFNHLDDAGIYNMGAGHDKPAESVTLLENVSGLTGLLRFAAAHTPLTGSLDFTGCSRLQYIECIESNVESVNLTGCTSLIRLVVEQTNLTTLDLNPVAANLRDLRGAAQQGNALTLTPLTAPLAALYHFCVREQVLVNHPTPAQLPVIQERWDWYTRESGVLTSASSEIRSLLTSGNHYTTADFTNQFPAGRNATLDANSNDLTAVDLTGCNGLVSVSLNHNRLDTGAVDKILATIASWGTSGGTLDLAANGVPSSDGHSSAATLIGRGWKVTTA
jgi:hypothetical protein